MALQKKTIQREIGRNREKKHDENKNEDENLKKKQILCLR